VILEIKELRKSFGGLLATNGVNLALEQGDLRAIIGPNGAGKTTLFHLISGYHKPDSGKIVFKGEDITHIPAHQICRKGLARSFQVVNIYPRLSVFENVHVAVLSHQGRQADFFSPAVAKFREKTLQILEDVGLGDQTEVRGDNLSHGDKKRLELGITLGNEPELLLLDEPTAGMSPEETVSTMSLIKDLAENRKLDIMFTEHDMTVVFGIAKSITVLHQGTIIAEGAPEEVRRDEEVIRVYFGEAI
jgi:branched-chain amino acid transport system ATP-binding protein